MSPAIPTARTNVERVKCRNTYVGETTDVGTESRTKQSFTDDCDINLIVARHASTGMWTHINPVAPTYGDFSQAMDLQDAIAAVNSAEERFNALPANVRAAAGNNPVDFLEMSADPIGFAHLVDAGLPVDDNYVNPLDQAEPSTTPPEGTPPSQADAE